MKHLEKTTEKNRNNYHHKINDLASLIILEHNWAALFGAMLINAHVCTHQKFYAMLFNVTHA